MLNGDILRLKNIKLEYEKYEIIALFILFRDEFDSDDDDDDEEVYFIKN